MTATTAELDARERRWRPDLVAALRGLYDGRADALADELVDRARRAAAERSADLVRLDRTRTIEPDWFQSPERVGYMAYVDRFGGDLAGVRGRLDHLTELGADVVHLLSLLTPRDGESDGGYAVRDYLRPDPRWGTPADLEALVTEMHARGMSLCVDFVLNHTSDDHDWAVRAREGSDYHRDLYISFPDRTQPDAFEMTLPEVFPHLAPGNFTWVDEMDAWVWTTFREFQWDLRWSNPDVMVEVADIALGLAALGVDILRLDAIAFTWKRLGTNCQNQPEAHLIAQALRAVLAIAAPATVLLAEAIVGPNELVGYLGRHELERRECEIGYHNQLMVQGWSMLASGRADLARVALDRLPDHPTGTTWFTYVRCHDDIGWAIDDADAAAIGVTGQGHRDFLAAFYRGEFWRSFARGTPFATNRQTGDERTSGMAATLAGVAAGLEAGDPDAVDLGVRRLLLLYGIAFGYGGIPIVYMGDELCQLDDTEYLDDPDRAADSRWAHRPAFDEALADRRGDPDTPAGRLWSGMRHLVETRRSCRQLHGAAASHPLDLGHPAVFAWHRHHPRYGDFLGIANVGQTIVSIAPPDWLVVAPAGPYVDRLDPADREPLRVEPLRVRWITTTAEFRTAPAVPRP